jgi:pimeloyl-ACP methyl ester carboxylesterase
MIEPVREEIPLAGGEVSALVWKNGGPLLHFAHANGFNSETYRGLLAPLSKAFTVVASDARGHGRTTLPTAPGMARNWDIFRDDLLCVLDRLGPAPALLAGHSMGAVASLKAAVLRPEKVRALVLIEPVFIPRMFRLVVFMQRILPFLKHEPHLWERALRRRDVFPSVERALAAYRGRGAFKTWPQETIVDYLKGGLEKTDAGFRLSCAPAWEAQCFRQAPSGAARLAGGLKCPVTLIHAENGTSRDEVEIFRRLCPQARIVPRKDASHFLPMEHPELVREEILKIAASAEPG